MEILIIIMVIANSTPPGRRPSIGKSLPKKGHTLSSGTSSPRVTGQASTIQTPPASPSILRKYLHAPQFVPFDYNPIELIMLCSIDGIPDAKYMTAFSMRGSTSGQTACTMVETTEFDEELDVVGDGVPAAGGGAGGAGAVEGAAGAPEVAAA